MSEDEIRLYWSNLAGGVDPTYYRNRWRIFLAIRRGSTALSVALRGPTGEFWKRVYDNKVDHISLYPSFDFLLREDEILFYQYCLTKGLPLEPRVRIHKDEGTNIRNFPVFWLLQNAALSKYTLVNTFGVIATVIATVWLFQMVPSVDHLAPDSVTVEDRELFRRYDNASHATFRDLFRFVDFAFAWK
jgi:hypothetical protein